MEKHTCTKRRRLAVRIAFGLSQYTAMAAGRIGGRSKKVTGERGGGRKADASGVLLAPFACSVVHKLERPSWTRLGVERLQAR